MTMGWGQIPSEARAAEDARRAAVEAAENQPMTQFERKLLGVLEDVRDAVQDTTKAVVKCAPTPLEPVQCCHGEEPLLAIQEGEGKVYTVRPGDVVTSLLDADGPTLSMVIDAGASALERAFPTMREDYTRSGFEKMAEAVIDGALKHAAAVTLSANHFRRASEADGDPTFLGGPTIEAPPIGSVQDGDASEPAGGESPDPPAGTPD